MKVALKRNRAHLIIVLFLILLFVGPAAYKIIFLKYPILSKPIENLRAFELKIKFLGSEGKDTIHHFLPRTEKGQNMVREDFISQNLYFFIGKEDGNLGIKWTGEGLKGEIQLFYRTTVQTTLRTFILDPSLPDKNYPPQLSRYLSLDDELESINVELTEFLKALLVDKRTKADRIKAIYDFLTQEVVTVSVTKDRSLTAPIKTKKATPHQKNKLFIHLARLVEVPTRSVHGIFLEDGIKQKKIHTWAEVYLLGQWIPVDLETRLFAQLPENLLILYRGQQPFLTSTTVKGLEYSYSVSKETQRTFSQFYETATQIGSKFHEWSLFLLPLETQQVFRVILMMPLGALIVSLYRNIIGINTFGTFMPVLIALAFRNTRLAWGLVLFSMVIILGLISRWYMDRLKLLLVPRLSVIVTVIIIMLAVGSVVGAHLGVYRIMAVALFPMVIMTMTIERLSIILMERGGKEAIKTSLGTLLVASSSYLAMSIASVQDFFFAFPEVLFALIAIQIL
ncbi:MAG: UUP1 family membrane protein, partial [Pseudomonadota bacterium]